MIGGTIASQFASPDSVAEWIALARMLERRARLLADDRALASGAWNDAGFAVECAIKAVIMYRERLNRWPEKAEHPEYYDHNLKRLAALAGIAITPSHPIAAAFKVVFDWNRSQTYSYKAMPRAVARGMVEAAFGEEGVVPWLCLNCLPKP